MNVEINADGSPFTNKRDSRFPNFEEAKNIAPCVFGQMIIERKLPTKYAHLIADVFFGSPEAFEEQFKHMSETMMNPMMNVPGNHVEPMRQQMLCQAIEQAFISIAGRCCTEKESMNYHQYAISKQIHTQALQELFSQNTLTEEETGRYEKAFADIATGINIFTVVNMEVRNMSVVEDEFLYGLIKEVFVMMKQDEVRREEHQKQAEVFKDMLNNMTADGQPINPAEFTEKLKAAGLVPVDVSDEELLQPADIIPDGCTAVSDITDDCVGPDGPPDEDRKEPNNFEPEAPAIGDIADEEQ